LHDTDHLSDRELYTWLWSDGLREETPDISQLGAARHTSPIGSGSDEDTMIFLKYYASEKERRHWKEKFPNDHCRRTVRCLMTETGICRVRSDCFIVPIEFALARQSS
jgi:hypothetical protein